MSGEGEVETKFCSNCKKDIAAANFVMHEVHCRRHIVLCQHCQEPVPRSELEQHFNDSHAKVKCDFCSDEIEKDLLEQHMESQCSRKPVKCLYCELEFPRNEQQEHLNYCGSRTEPCIKCQQYVMLKDQVQHEESNCQFPTPKPVTNGGPPGGQDSHLPRDSFGDFGDFAHDPFTFEEIHRLLSQPGQLQTQDVELDGDLGFSAARQPRSTRVQTRLVNNDRQRKTVNKKSNVNRQREQGTRSRDVNFEADRQLALRLQQEQSDEIDRMLRDLQKESPRSPGTGSQHQLVSELDERADVNSFPEEEDLLPCEFCGEAVPMDFLVEHQSHCDPLASGTFRSQDINALERNNQFDTLLPRRHNSIPVINNLEPVTDFRAGERFSEMLADSSSSDEDVMLPCEFCADLFPGELLVQHQSVCDANPLMTPRVMTPIDSRSNLMKTNYVSPLGDNIRDRYTSRSRRHQGPPDFSALPNDRLYDDFDSVSSTSSHSQTPNSDSSENIRSTLNRYGVQYDRNVDPLTRPPLHSNRGQLYNDIGNVRAAAGSRRQRSSNPDHTKEILDQLLQTEDYSPPYDLLANVSNGQKKSSKNEDNVSRRRSTGQVNRPGATRRKSSQTSSNARDVQRQLDDEDRVPRLRQSRLNGAGDSSQETNGMPRQRQRGDHVFNHNPSSQDGQRYGTTRHSPSQQQRALNASRKRLR